MEWDYFITRTWGLVMVEMVPVFRSDVIPTSKTTVQFLYYPTA